MMLQEYTSKAILTIPEPLPNLFEIVVIAMTMFVDKDDDERRRAIAVTYTRPRGPQETSRRPLVTGRCLRLKAVGRQRARKTVHEIKKNIVKSFFGKKTFLSQKGFQVKKSLLGQKPEIEKIIWVLSLQLFT